MIQKYATTISLTSSMCSSSEESKTKHENFYRPNDGSNIGLVRDDDTLEICYDLKGITCDSAIRLASGAKGAKVKKYFINNNTTTTDIVLDINKKIFVTGFGNGM